MPLGREVLLMNRYCINLCIFVFRPYKDAFRKDLFCDNIYLCLDFHHHNEIGFGFLVGVKSIGSLPRELIADLVSRG